MNVETLTGLLLKSRYRNRLVTPEIINRLLTGSSARQWGLVNRALKSGELIKLKRGLYLLSSTVTGADISRFRIANRMVPESYISQETALGHYGWLLEEPLLTQSCIGQGRSREHHNIFGEFSYERISVSTDNFLKGVNRVPFSGVPVLIASQERALGDAISRRGLEWQGIVGICEQLRTDVANICGLDLQVLRELSGIYRHRKTNAFLSNLVQALGGGR